MSKRKKAPPRVPVGFRLPAETVERLDSAVEMWTAATGVETTRTAIATAALKRGLEEIMAELGAVSMKDDKKGTCPACGGRLSLTRHGVISGHSVRTRTRGLYMKKTCAGTGAAPVEAEEAASKEEEKRHKDLEAPLSLAKKEKPYGTYFQQGSTRDRADVAQEGFGKGKDISSGHDQPKNPLGSSARADEGVPDGAGSK